MSLSQEQAEGLLLRAAIQKYVELRTPTTHMRGYFTPQMYDTTVIPLEIMRDNDYVAVDVMRGTNGNLNKGSIYSAKDILPPAYHEKFNINELKNYERAFGQAAANSTLSQRAALANETAQMLVKLQNKIIRAEEIQCVQALETGVITLNTGDDIDFKRKSGSLVDNSATPWTNVATDVEGQFQAAGDFIRQYGANSTGVLDATMSGQAWIALQKTTFFKDKANYDNISLMSIGNPQQRNGATFHGQITAGAYIVNIWVYDGTYLNSSNVRTRLTDETKVIIVPTQGTQFELAYGAVDQIVKSSGAQSVSGVEIAKGAADYYVWDSVDLNNLTRTLHMSSAPVARLITVDMVYTMKIATAFTNPAQQ